MKKEKKHIIAYLLLATMLLPFFSSGMNVTVKAASSEEYSVYDFNSYTTGETPSVNYIRNDGEHIVTIEEFPSADNKSLTVKTRDTKQFLIDMPVRCQSQCVIEASVAYEGTLASNKNIFCVDSSSGVYIVFMRLSKGGILTLFDGTELASLNKGVFYNIALLLDFETKKCSVKINGRTKVMDIPFPDSKFIDTTNSRIHFMNIDGDSEIFYINRYRSYKGKEVIEGYIEGNIESLPSPPKKVNITDEMVKERLDGNLLMTTKTGKAYADGQYVEIDETNPNTAPKIINGRTFVPLRFISEAFGAQVSYDNVTQTANISLNDTNIRVTSGNKKFVVNGVEKNFDAVSHIVDDRLFVPLRAIAESLGKQVFYDKCGYIIVGNNAAGFSLSDQTDKKILDKASRELLFETPTPQDVINDLKATNPNKEHPRILITKDELPALRLKIENDEKVKEWMNDVIETADQSIGSEPLDYGATDGVRMTYICDLANERIRSCGFTYLMTGDEKYAQEVVTNVMNICSFPDWHPNHFLDTARLAMAVAVGYDWCYDYFTDEQKKTVRDALVEYSMKEIMKDFKDEERDRSYKWSIPSSTYPTNWISHCCGGVSLAALAIGDEDAEAQQLCGEIISRGLNNLKDLLAAFAPDGAWYEGNGYWMGTYEGFSICFNAYKTALGTDYGLTNSPGLHEGAYYEIGTQHEPIGCINLSDCSEALINPTSFLWLSNLYNDPGLTKYYTLNKKDKGNVFDIIWYNPELNNGELNIAEDGYYREVEITTSRTGFGKQDLFFAFHGAEDGRDNSHLDGGTFFFDLFGQRWARDMGSEPSDYLHTGIRRWDKYRCRAEGHNTLSFNPSYLDDQNRFAICPVDRFEYNDYSSVSSSDLTELYAYKNVESMRRTAFVDKVDKTVTVQDEIVMKKPGDFYWFMHTYASGIDVDEDGRSATLTIGYNSIGAKIIGDDNLKFEAMRCVPLDVSPSFPGIVADDSDSWKLAIHAEDIKQINYAIVLFPLCGNEKASDFVTKPIEASADIQLREETDLPKLSGITVGGKSIDEFKPDTYFYEGIYDPNPDNASANIIEATGDGEIKIEQISKYNFVARISVTKNNKTNYYFVNFTKMSNGKSVYLERPSEFTTATPDYIGETDELVSVKPETLYAAHVPQEENQPEYVCDGNLETRWSSDKMGTEIQFDFGTAKRLTHVGLAFMWGNERGSKFRILVSEDGKHWETRGDLVSSGTTNEMEIYNIGENKVQYVKIVGYGNTEDSAWFSPTEIGFFTK